MAKTTQDALRRISQTHEIESNLGLGRNRQAKNIDEDPYIGALVEVYRFKI